MNQNRLPERIGILLAVLMSAAALGLQIRQQRASAPPPVPANTPQVDTPPLAPEMTPDGKIMPLPVPPGGKEILGKGKDLIRVQGIRGGRKQYELTAQRLVLTRDDSTTTAEGIRGAVIVAKDGKPSVTFSAERAIMDMRTKDLDIQGEVLVESLDAKNKVSFTTRTMHWNALEERLTCPNAVEVTQPGVLLRGNSMVADAKLRKLSLDGGVYLEADAEKVESSLGVTRSGSGKKSSGKSSGSAKGDR